MAKQAIDVSYFVHESAVIDEGACIGEATKIWHFTHVMKDSKIGRKCNIGQNCVICPGVQIGDHVKIQNNVSVYTDVFIEDDVFLGPSMVFTNVINPRSFIERKHEFKKTLVQRGATIGANATVVCGITIGQYAFIGAGSVVTKDIPPYALVYGNPGKIHGWVCRCGSKLSVPTDYHGKAVCNECASQYEIVDHQVKMAHKGNYASTSPTS